MRDSLSRNFGQFIFCFLHCKVPRITTSDGKVRTVDVPWARAQSGFTLLFEAFALALIEREMPVSRVAEILGVNPQRVWTVFNHWVGQARASDDPSSITRLGVDETSSKKGHSYVTIGVDLDESRVVHACQGKGKACMQSMADYLTSKGVAEDQITELSMDLSPAFIAGARESFANAQITFDRFHVVKLLNEAMNKVRIAERKEHAALKGHKYTFLKNKEALSSKKKVHAEQRLRTHLMKRHKVKGRRIGEGRFPSVKLYAQHGLYKVPTAAAWRVKRMLEV
jgi:transposase